MKNIWVVPAFCIALSAATGAQAGCLAGAAVGGVARPARRGSRLRGRASPISREEANG